MIDIIFVISYFILLGNESKLNKNDIIVYCYFNLIKVIILINIRPESMKDIVIIQ